MTTEPGFDPAVLGRLVLWFSPVFPVGGFAYSHGIEWLAETGEIGDAAALEGYLADLIAAGSLRTDALLLSAAWRAETEAERSEIAELADALSGSAERHLETMEQGRAFVAAARAWDGDLVPLLPERVAYPVAVGAVGAAHRLPLEPLLLAFLNGVAANLVQAGQRIIPIGQQQGVRVLAGLAEPLGDLARFAATHGLDELGSLAFAAEIASMRHETQGTRIFRS